MRSLILAGLLAASAAAPAQSAPAPQVSATELRNTITTLVAFGTRHSASDTKSETRGIGAARRWAAGRFAAISQACGDCLTVETPSVIVTAPRLPVPTEIVDVLGIQRGTTDPDRVVIIAAHIDSRNSDPLDAVGDAPGANDDGSGVAAVIEAARVLSQRKFAATIVYAVLSGEEQGLHGGKLLAATAKAKGWRVEADLNNDIVGNTLGSSGARDDKTIRVFAEGTKATETPEQASKRRYNGGEVDSPARNLARFVEGFGPAAGLKVEIVYRTDRYSRGGDQVPMLEAGYPAVRLTERQENYDRQHQNVRFEGGKRYGDTLDGVDFAYLAKVTLLNVAALAALASAPAPPTEVTISGAVTADTVLRWNAVPGAARYVVWWRKTTSPVWQYSRGVGSDLTATLEGIDIDSWFFGVSAVAAGGSASPVVFPGDAGSF